MLFLFALCLQAQAVEVQRPEAATAPDLERIRHALERPKIDSIEDRDVPVFRIYIREHPLPAQRLWTDETLRPLYVRTYFPLNHQEFLATVTPEEFRAATLYPIGVDAISVIDDAIKSIRKAMRERAEARTRKIFQQELQLLLEARKNAEKDR
jgi:hypothetical protein